ncbi:MAG TPA: hypothetical protein VFU69_17830 [Ktedonobacterales bacterium]|nr:hypothetical protein [Ktedonobacterales bacterium]
MELPKVTDLPRMAKVRQLLPRDKLDDVEGAVRVGLRKLNLGNRIKQGHRIGITAGSRGAGGMVPALKAIIAEVKADGGEPFIIPAMGSHGNATPEGQKYILACFGVTEQSMGVPIDARMETVVLGTGYNGYEAHYAVSAKEADGIIVLARTTVHPNLKAGEKSDGVASGLLKMTMIGLGKQPGAQSAHHHGLAKCVLQVPDLQLKHGNIIAGVSMVENAYREPYYVEVVPLEEFKASDQRQLKLAQSLLGQIPFDELDVLIADQMGKDIAGSGLDPNVIGFWRFEGGPHVPNFRRIVSLDLTEASAGNAIGIGLNDVVTRRLVDKMSKEATYMNLLTGANKDGSTVEGYIPIIAETDREALELALGSIMPSGAPNVCHIHDTSRLEEMMISEALFPLAKQLPNIEVLTELQPPPFDQEGRLQWL